MPLLRHALTALALSVSLSIAFYALFGVFVMPGFVIMSLAAAAVGLAVGWFMGKRLWLTALVTLVVRVGIFWIATGGDTPIPCG